MTPQETHAAVVSLLQQQGLPLTTANLNRGMLALVQNDMQSEGAAMSAVNRSMDRTMGAAQQSASRPTALPTPPIPPTAAMPPSQELTTPTTSLDLNTLKALQAAEPSVEQMAPQANTYNADTAAAAAPDMLTMRGVPEANLYDAKTADKPVTMPREPGYITSGINAAVRYANDKLTPTAQEPFTYDSMMADIRNGHVPNPNPDMPIVMFGTGPAAGARNAYPAMQQFMRQRTVDAMRQNPPRPPSNMLNQAGEGFEEAMAARAAAGQRTTYQGEGVDNFLKGGNTQTPTSSTPSSSMKSNTPTWKGESDPSTPMGTRPTQAQSAWRGEGDPSAPMGTRNTAAPRTPAQDTSGAGAAIKQSLTKQKQMAASKTTRKSKSKD